MASVTDEPFIKIESENAMNKMSFHLTHTKFMDVVDESRLDTNGSILNMGPQKKKNDIDVIIDRNVEGMTRIENFRVSHKDQEHNK